MNNLKHLIKQKRLYLDGGTGTVLQSMGLPSGMPPEMWNIDNPDAVISLHKGYFEAGSNIVATNTFGVNCKKYGNYKELIAAAFDCAKKAKEGFEGDRFIALDIGPTGKLLKPLGELDFEDAVEIFASNVREGVKNGADLILIETMNDSLETKAAVIAAKENSDLPIFVTNVYDESEKLMTGANPEAMITLLEALGVDAIGMNCSLGPDKMLPIVEKFAKFSSTPIIVKPNAGLPVIKDAKTVFDKTAEEFSDVCTVLAQKGACILGGCCGTTPEYIKLLVEKTENLPYSLPSEKNFTAVSSYTHAHFVGQKPTLIGERINPTGKSKLKAALREGDMGYIISEAVKQEEKGVHILDVNVGLPEIDEISVMKRAVEEIQSVTALPLQLDSSNPAVLEAAMRIYNGKPLVNSVNGTEESMNAVLPLVKKYGGTLIALTLDESGIPETASERLAVAQKIAERAKQYGISKKDIIVDPLALTVSSDKTSARVTIEAIKMLCENGFYTSLGVSNISFGLPSRETINSAFFTMALENGLSCAIMNPFSKGMTDSYYAFCALSGRDSAFENYIGYVQSQESEAPTNQKVQENDESLEGAIVKGLREKARYIAKRLCENENPLEIIGGKIIPALNTVGTGFEEKKIFLPQLLMSAESASLAFEEIKAKMPKGKTDISKAVILATVKGDIHDIGKNIVKVLLESYGFVVYDLGRDVAPEKILEEADGRNCNLVGLSALMTTTVPAMEQTIKLLHEKRPTARVMVGGAVLNEEYAQMINADFYGKDAMESVKIAERFYGIGN
ncbi:MAG: homocysteine S-methyltransferase family protein [Clostridia bacterium]|nr:homocysteine S-methyltransferase family protein [Clostridia bacterium]